MPKALIVSLRPSGPAHAGDQIVLTRATRFLETHFRCVVVLLERGGASRKIKDALLGIPPELSGYVTAQDRRIVCAALEAHQPAHVFILHEGLFPLRRHAAAAGRPCTLLAHNLLSRFTYGATALDALGGWAARRHERRWYAPSGDDRLIFLSQGDRAAALRLFRKRQAHDIRVCLPGAPTPTALDDDATFSPELVLTGSYAWWRKRRDLQAFGRIAPTLPIHVFDPSAVDVLPRAVLHRSSAELDWTGRLRVGVVSDRFVGGFKLKALEYVARNCAIFSFSPIAEEFSGLPFYELFVKTPATQDLSSYLQLLQAEEPKALVTKFSAFKAACLERFDWEKQLLQLLPDDASTR